MVSLRWRLARLRRRLAGLRFSPIPAMADNCVPAEGGIMPRLDDTAVEEGLARLPGWERRGDQIVKSPHGRGRPPWRMKMVLVAR